MNMLGTVETTGRLPCSFDLELGRGTGGLALRAESALVRKQLMGHINRKSMDVLRKQAGNGVEYNGETHACDVRAVGTSEQQAHPKQVAYDVQRAFQIVTVDTMGSISPQALGGYNCVTKFVD